MDVKKMAMMMTAVMMFNLLLAGCAATRDVRAKQADKVFTSKATGAKFVLIPAGTFIMGSPPGEAGRPNPEVLKELTGEAKDIEKQHRTTISQPFYMQTTVVTQGQWRALMGNNPAANKDCGINCPVENVSWNDVQRFIGKLNEREGTDRYRLPTEAEWEYAARAGSTAAYCFGADAKALGDYAWYIENAGFKTHPVEMKKPNAWGLHDMYGNVWQWIQDRHGDYPDGPVTDPAGPPSGEKRVQRGCSILESEFGCRSASRLHGMPGERNPLVGFRLIRTLSIKDLRKR
jgi:formylglycine-generating enzyme required for sulfatase activity